MIKKYLKDCRGYQTLEVLIVLAAVASIAGAVVFDELLPAFRDMHDKVKDSITGISETGF